MILKFLFGAITLIASVVTHAGNVTAKVDQIFFHAGNEKVLFSVDVKNFHSCATSSRYAITLSTEQGKAMVSAILAAKMSGKKLSIFGANSCSIHPDAEDISYFSILN